MVCAHPSICSGEWDVQSPLGFWDKNGSPNHVQSTRPSNNKQKERTYRVVNFSVLADHKVNLKKGEKKDKYLNLPRESKKTWNINVTVIPTVIVALGTVSKLLAQGMECLKIRDEWKPSKKQHYGDRPEYWEECRRLEETCCHSNSSEKPSANAGVKDSKMSSK